MHLRRLIPCLIFTLVAGCIAAGCGESDEPRATKAKTATAASTASTATDSPAEAPPAKEAAPPVKAPVPTGRTYSPAAATKLTISRADQAALMRLAISYAASHPGTTPRTITGFDEMPNYAGWGSAEYASAYFEMGDAPTLVQFLFKRTSEPRGAWTVVSSSMADDISFPCSWPRPLLMVWNPDLAASC